MLSTFSRVVVRGRWFVPLLWIVVAAGLAMVAPNLQDEANASQQQARARSTAEATKASELVSHTFPKIQEATNNQVTVTFFRPGGLTDADAAYARALEQAFTARRESIRLTSIASPFTDQQYAATLLSQDRQAALLHLNLAITYASTDSGVWLAETKSIIPRVRQLLPGTGHARYGAPTAPAGLQVNLTSGNALLEEMYTRQESSLSRTLVMTIVFILVVLLIVYRSVVAALVPLIGVGLALTVAQGVLGFAAHAGLGVSPNALVFLIVVLFGAGTDYSMLIISRFRENLLEGTPRDQALRTALPSTAEAILSSACAVIVAFGCMWFARDFGFRGIGPALAIAVLIELVVLMTLVPAVLAIMGEKVFWPFLPSKQRARRLSAADTQAPPRRDLWERIAASVTAAPVRYIVITTLALLPFLGLLQRFTFDNNELRALLPTSTDSYRGLQVMTGHFGQGAGAENGATIIIQTQQDLWSPGNLRAIERVSADLEQIPGISRITTATRPTGVSLTPDRLREILPTAADDGAPANAGTSVFEQPGDALQRYPDLRSHLRGYFSDSGTSVLLTATLRHDPYSDEAFDTISALRLALRASLRENGLGQTTAYVGGVSAEVKDNLDIQRRDFVLIFVVVVVGIYLILLLLVRSPIPPLYMVGTIALSYAATMGITYATFAYGFGYSGLWFDTPVAGFVILVALGVDYSIFLMTRIKEEYHGHGRSTTVAVRNGLARTGSVITSCGIIMAGTFTPLMLSGVKTYVEMGFAIVVGLLLDTFVIRTLLVPALAVQIGDHNWWPRRRHARPNPQTTSAQHLEHDPTSQASSPELTGAEMRISQ